MEITIHRGTHQIGGCVTEIRVGNERILIDFGANLPGTDDKAKISDTELVDTFFGEEGSHQKEKISAVLYTHYHGDHCGLYKEIPEDVPQYIGPVAKQILQTVAEYIDKESPKKGQPILNRMKTYSAPEPILQDDFKEIKVTPFYMDHSALDAYMFLIEAEGKKILFTGDFREHGIVGENDRCWQVVKKYIPKNIDLLITEGTMISRLDEVKKNEIRTEEELGKESANIFSEHRYNYVLVSSTNLDSIMEFYHNTPKDRMFVCDFYQAKLMLIAMKGMKKKGYYSLYRPSKHHQVIYLVDYSEEKEAILKALMEDLDFHLEWKACSIRELKKNGFVMLVRKNSYPEGGKNRFEKIRDAIGKKDSNIVYSMWKGYLEGDKQDKAVTDFLEGYDYDLLHTSGHAYVETIAELAKIVDPKKIIPMHTESPEAFLELPALAEFKERIKVIEDREVFRF